MASIYSTRFLGSAGLTGTGPSYTVAAGDVVIVRFVSLYCDPGLFPATAFLEDDLGGQALAQDAWSPGQPHYTGLAGRWVFPAGSGFHLQFDNPGGTAGVDYSVNGYLLTA